MASPSQPAHLSSHHRQTLHQILGHPVSHNVEWRAVISLFEAIGSVETRHRGGIAVTLGSEHVYFDPKGRKDADTKEVAEMRRLLSAAGYSSQASGHG